MSLLPAPKRSDAERLGIYLNDHLTGATAGVELLRRSATSQRDPGRRAELSRVAEEAAADRQTLLSLMRVLDIPVKKHRVAAGWVTEHVGRLKMNGALLRRAPLSDLLEVEAMLLGVTGKRSLWRLLGRRAAADPRLSADEMQRLEQRASDQLETLEQVWAEAAAVLKA